MGKPPIDLFKDIPYIKEPSYKMEVPNQSILIYEGKFKVKNIDTEIVLDGKIEFKWLPYLASVFKAQTNEVFFKINELFNSNNELDLFVDGEKLSSCYISSFGGEEGVQGVLSNLVVKGDKTIPVEKVIFSIPNFKKFLGSVIRTNEHAASKSRIELNNQKYDIIIDALSNYKDLEKKLKVNGGFINLYAGEIVSRKGKVLHSEIKELLYCFSTL